MDLIDEEDIVGLERCEESGEVTGLVEDRTGGDLKAYAKFVGDDVREGGLTESRRTEEQHVVERLAAQFGCLDEDLEVRGHFALPCKVGEA